MASPATRPDQNADFFASFQLMERYLERLSDLQNVQDRREFFQKVMAVLAPVIDPCCHQVHVWDEESSAWRLFDDGAEGFALPGVSHEGVLWALDRTQYNLVPEPDPRPELRCYVVLPFVVRDRPTAVLVAGTPFAHDQLPLVVSKLIAHFSRQVESVFENLELYGKIQQLRNLFDNIIESVPHALLAMSTSGRVLAMNTNAEFMFDVKSIFALDENFKAVFSPAVAEVFTGLMVKALSGESLIDYEFEHSLDGKVSITIGISTSLLQNRNDKPIGVLFLCRDLSLSREVTKLRELDQLKTEFVNTVSHELKTPLTAIIGGVEILQADAATLGGDQVEIVGVIAEGARRLQTLISDLLDLSKLQSGTVQLKEGVFALADLVREALAVQKRSDKHAIKLEVQKDLPGVVVDGQKILQVLTNLVSNAIKYSPAGGAVVIRCRLDGEWVRVEVQDQGLGIRKEDLGKIWEKFYRVDSSLSSEIEGTGLGLTIVKHIVELHGGKIWAESEHGKGSTFIFLLPLRVGLANER
ncbi:MAG: PAS domain-containing protein [Planctomycetes bacterium]|nr:PAS domain-containing protein [Planctomycetota bacterium]